MSTSTGRAPVLTMEPAVAKNEYVLVMTSSPGPTPSAIRATSSASVPEDTPMAWRDADGRGQLALERLHLGAEDEPLAVADARDRGQRLVADLAPLPRKIEKRHGHRRRRLCVGPTVLALV